MTTIPNAGYDGRPVILTHLVVDLNSRLAFCSDQEYWEDLPDSYPGVPRMLCPACAHAPRGYAVEVPDDASSE